MKDVDDLYIYARDLDGTGSMHVCSQEDLGAVRFFHEDTMQAIIQRLCNEAEREQAEGNDRVAELLWQIAGDFEATQ